MRYVQQSLGWNTTHVQTGATQRSSLFNANCLHSELSSLNCGNVAYHIDGTYLLGLHQWQQGRSSLRQSRIGCSATVYHVGWCVKAWQQIPVDYNLVKVTNHISGCHEFSWVFIFLYFLFGWLRYFLFLLCSFTRFSNRIWTSITLLILHGFSRFSRYYQRFWSSLVKNVLSIWQWVIVSKQQRIFRIVRFKDLVLFFLLLNIHFLCLFTLCCLFCFWLLLGGSFCFGFLWLRLLNFHLVLCWFFSLCFLWFFHSFFRFWSWLFSLLVVVFIIFGLWLLFLLHILRWFLSAVLSLFWFRWRQPLLQCGLCSILNFRFWLFWSHDSRFAKL